MSRDGWTREALVLGALQTRPLFLDQQGIRLGTDIFADPDPREMTPTPTPTRGEQEEMTTDTGGAKFEVEKTREFIKKKRNFW